MLGEHAAKQGNLLDRISKNHNSQEKTIRRIKNHVISSTPTLPEVQELKNIWEPKTAQQGPVDRRSVEQKKHDAYNTLLKQRDQLNESRTTLSESKFARASADFEQSAADFHKTYLGGVQSDESAATSLMGYLQDKGGLTCYNLHKETWQNNLDPSKRLRYEFDLENPNGFITLLRKVNYIPLEDIEVSNELELRDLLQRFEQGKITQNAFERAAAKFQETPLPTKSKQNNARANKSAIAYCREKGGLAAYNNYKEAWKIHSLTRTLE